MLIEIYGAKFVNKGAELMLLSIVDKVKARYPSAEIVLSCSSMAEWSELDKKGFKKKLTYRKNRFLFKDLGVFIPKFIRNKYGIVLDKEIDVIFEASGFAYGDQWTHRMAVFITKFTKGWKKNGSKVIFMPQAFGPFNKDANYRATRTALQNGDLIYARDKVSLDYLNSLKLDKSIIQSPDFTMVLNGITDVKYSHLKNMACIIPNNKVISTSNDPDIEGKYISFFLSVINYFRQHQIEPFILIHEGEKDYQLAKKIQNQDQVIEIVWEKDPLKIKGIIGDSKAVIGSRFHGLVSALSQGVPSCAVGWSHKYEMLFSDFHISKGILTLDLSEEDTNQRLGEMFQGENYGILKNTIEVRALQLKDKINKMWNEIYELIDSK